ncbi:hypothetical protein [Sphingobium sp. AntQ-1]|uniref:hypothetical protein n=1 Tax=Sphingobium sp. AntQ-1 TaxID=2930091 RepID=UPI00234E504A|nr:hypothetical protein [Sphingobium sp. AntQ-1]
MADTLADFIDQLCPVSAATRMSASAAILLRTGHSPIGQYHAFLESWAGLQEWRVLNGDLSFPARLANVGFVPSLVTPAVGDGSPTVRFEVEDRDIKRPGLRQGGGSLFGKIGLV